MERSWPRGRPRVPGVRGGQGVLGLLGLLALLGVLGAGLSGCAGSRAPAAGVTRIDRSVVVAYKPCPGDDGALGRLALFSSDDVDVPVWEARRTPGSDQPAVLELPVVKRYPGYDVADRRPGGTLDPALRYSFEATSTDGTEWGGPDFRLDGLTQGTVQVAGEELAFTEWVDRPASCPKEPRVGALLGGAVVAAAAGGALVGLRRLTRRGRRAP